MLEPGSNSSSGAAPINTVSFNKKVQYFFSCFILGFSDALSPYWVSKILFMVNPTTKQSHPSSYKLLKTFRDAFIQLILLFICVPALLAYIGFDGTALIARVVFLLLNYGYVLFYNMETMAATKDVMLWAGKFPNTHFPPPDAKQKFSILYSLSNMVKSLIFLLLYYTPINVILTLFSLYSPKLGNFILLFSESFFNATFYFLEKWPYDRYNIAFIQQNLPYMLGYGFFISFLCNIVLSGFGALGAFFAISLWMMVNCQLHGPGLQEKVKQVGLKGIWECVKNRQKRAELGNAFNFHRQQLRKDKAYRKKLQKNTVIVKPALLLTEIINKKLGKLFGLKMQKNGDKPNDSKPSQNQQQKAEQQNIILELNEQNDE